MPAPKIAIQLRSLQLPLKKSLQTASSWGIQAVEIDARGELRPGELSQTGLRQFKKLLEDLNVQVVAVGFRTRRGYDAMEDLDRRVEATKEAMTFARALGASLVVNQVGRVPEEGNSKSWTTLVEVLSDLAAFGQRAGAMLAAETGTESGADLRRLVAALPPGGLAVTLNPGNLIVNGFSVPETVAELGSDLVYVHATDGVRDLARGRGLEVPLGRGVADYPYLLGALEERGYRGHLCVERHQSDNPLAEIGQAVKFLQELYV